MFKLLIEIENSGWVKADNNRGSTKLVKNRQTNK